jgi:hypothetical protein
MSRLFGTLPLAAILTAALTAAPVASQVPLEGQMPGIGGPRLLRIGFGGGMTVPVGDTEEAWDTGLNGQAFLLISPPFLPTIRLNLGYERFDFKEAVANAVTGQTSVMSGVAGIFMPLFGIGPLTPYVSAGLGAFRIDESLETGVDPEAAFHFGIDGGAGIQLRIGRLEGFVEGHVKNVYTDEGGVIDTSAIRYVPVSFGLVF